MVSENLAGNKGRRKTQYQWGKSKPIPLETANTFSGGLMAHSTQNEPFYIVAAADASFGTGDVTLRKTVH
jgi:hypothetical protein